MPYPMDTVFEGVESRRRLSKRQIGYGAWKEGLSVERVGDGLVVDGERYEPVSE